MDIKFDLNSPPTNKELLDSIQLSIPDESMLFRMVRRNVNITYSKISIENLNVANEIICNSHSQLITIQSKHLNIDYVNKATNCLVDTNNINIEIFIDLSTINDIISKNVSSRDQVLRLPIFFELHLVPDGNQKAEIIKYEVILEVIPEKAIIEIGYESNINEIEYGLKQNHKLGYVELNRKNNYSYSYVQESFIIDDIDYLSRGSTDIAIKVNGAMNELRDKDRILIPVEYMLANVQNPHKPINLTKTINCKYGTGTDQVLKKIDINFLLIPDSTEVELSVKLFTGDYIDINKTNEYSIQNKYQWLGTKKTGKVNCFKFQLLNLAENGNGYIGISNFRIDIDYDKEKLIGKEDVIFSLDNVEEKFKLFNKKDSNKEFTVGFRHDNIKAIINQSAKVKFNISCDYVISKDGAVNNDIQRIYVCRECLENQVKTIIPEINEYTFCNVCNSKYQAFIEINNEYKEFDEYLSIFFKQNQESVDEENVDYLTPQKLEKTIVLEIEENTGNSWLALDFGTSASVAAFADPDTLERGKEEDILINMTNSLQKLYSKNKNASFSEGNDYIISSEILLRSSINSENKICLDADQYWEDIIHISPSKDELIERGRFRIPYLKSLIGFEELPDPNNVYEDIKFYKNKKDSTPILFKDEPLKINQILKNVYNSFVRDFIKPQIEGKEGLDKLIITVPNTFTPKHIETIRGIILDQFPFFRQKYIEFISESDAVACDYIANWNEYNVMRDNRDEQRNQEEYVLVYDIGAGTTDLTLFKLSNLKNGKRRLNVLGKLGKSTAGNYLDYKIAQIIDSLTDVQVKMTVDYENNPIVFQNKNFIKNELKPSLNQEDKFLYIKPNGELSFKKETGNESEIQLGKITNNELMKYYLIENSIDIIRQFYHLFNQIDPGISKANNASKIDTVIFTGRAILFKRLREELKRVINDFASNESPIHFSFREDEDELKSIVVKGALNYALRYRESQYSSIQVSSRNLMARYGFVYRNIERGEWDFLEVLNPSTQPLNRIPHKRSGLSIFEYDSDEHNALGDSDKMFINMQDSVIGYFVQSYSIDTAQDVNESDWDYITVMFSFNRNEVANQKSMDKIPVRVRVTDMNEMIVNVGNFEEDPKAPLRTEHNQNQNQTFKKSLWPYV